MPPPDENPLVPGRHVSHVPLNCVTVTENKPCQEAANPKVRPPSATPNDRPATARATKMIGRPPSSGFAIGGRRTGARGHNAGTTSSPNCSPCKTLYAQLRRHLGEVFHRLAEALRAIAELNLTELQAIIPPSGFGRD